MGPFSWLVSPFLHGSWLHFIGNSISFFSLAFITLSQRLRFKNALQTFLKVSILICLSGGLCVWCVGRTGIHVGASGWIFGLIGYNLVYGFYQTFVCGEPKWIGMLISVCVVFFYIGTFLSAINPLSFTRSGVSAEGHLCSLICGCMFACVKTGSHKEDEKKAEDDELHVVTSGSDDFQISQML